MIQNSIKCVVLADRHHGLTEGIRSLLETKFDAVVMVADETSLTESAARLQPSVVVADLALARGENFGWLHRLLARCPNARVVVLSAHDEKVVEEQALAAGAVGLVRKREIATRLLPLLETILAGDPPGTGHSPMKKTTDG
jgi:two-component system invasion response regulator UvrY